MLKHNVPVDPMNYAIWYHYVAGLNGELTQVIDKLIEDQQPFDTDTTLNLYISVYKKYICNASIDEFEKINSNLLKLITQTSSSINTASEKASVIGDNFSNTLKVLESKDDSNIKSVLVEIILQTTQLAEASKDLKNQLDETQKEMEELKKELVVVRQTANTDKLTGLLNRWAFDKALEALIHTTAPNTACLAILDIDNFKRVNDGFGHLVGDKVIKHIAAAMPNTTLAEAFELVEQIRLVLDASRLTYKGNTEAIGKVTVSAGIASLQTKDEISTLLTRADKALYRAKETGRNKVVTETALLQ